MLNLSGLTISISYGDLYFVDDLLERDEELFVEDLVEDGALDVVVGYKDGWVDGNLKLIVERGVAPSEVENEVVLSLFSPSKKNVLMSNWMF